MTSGQLEISSKIYLNNTKLSKVLPHISIDHSEHGANLTNLIKNNTNIKTSIILSTNDPSITSSVNLSRFDIAVLDFVSTIISLGTSEFSSYQVALLMYPGKRITETKVASIDASIQILSATTIRIDCREEFKALVNIDDGEYSFNGYLLPLNKITTPNGTFYSVLCMSNGQPSIPVFNYAFYKRQLITIDQSWLNTPTSYFSDTEETICIKAQLFLRVHQILNHKNTLSSNRISYFWEKDPSKGLIASLGYEVNRQNNTYSGGPCSSSNHKTIKTNWNRKKCDIKKIVEGSLQHLVDINAIGGFKNYHKKGSKETIGYEIYPPKKIIHKPRCDVT